MREIKNSIIKKNQEQTKKVLSELNFCSSIFSVIHFHNFPINSA